MYLPDEEDVGGVYGDGLAPALAGRVLLGDVDHRPLNHLQHRVLHTLAAHVAELKRRCRLVLGIQCDYCSLTPGMVDFDRDCFCISRGNSAEMEEL